MAPHRLVGQRVLLVTAARFETSSSRDSILISGGRVRESCIYYLFFLCVHRTLETLTTVFSLLDLLQRNLT